MQKKLVLLFAGIVLAFALLVGRITYINAFNGDKYSKIVLDQQQYQSRMIPFKRGDIVDRNGTKLATSQRVYNVILATARCAIRTLTRWIKRNNELYAELLLTGYHARVRTFMPRQVGIIVRYLNEP